ncbi:hypothetical protein P3S68_011139 [Capsicum galapagoense]
MAEKITSFESTSGEWGKQRDIKTKVGRIDILYFHPSFYIAGVEVHCLMQDDHLDEKFFLNHDHDHNHD